MARQPEAKLSKSIVEDLKKKPKCIAWKIAGGLFQAAGLPDIIGCYRGKFFGLEVKMPGRENTVTPRQASILKKIRMAGGISAVVTTREEAKEAVFGKS